MARRMFSTDIVNSDPFLEMPSSSQVLYFHLGIHSDDDGFVYPKKIMRMMNAGEDDLKILLAKKFLISFESGVVVQKHWRVNNYIRPDRYKNTSHREEMAQLSTDKGLVYHLSTERLPSGSISKEVSKKVEGSKDPENANAPEADNGSASLKMAEIRENLRKSKTI